MIKLSLSLFLLAMTSCSLSTYRTKRRVPPLKSFVHITNTIHIKTCLSNLCIEHKPLKTMGSGGIVYKSKSYDYILTAEHVCNAKPGILYMLMNRIPLHGTSIRNQITFTYNNGEIQAGEVMFYNKKNDLCLIKTKSTHRNSIPVSIKPSLELGERVVSISSPLGAFKAGPIPWFYGYTFGKQNTDKFQVGASDLQHYVLHSSGGSSGGLILDYDNLEVVGTVRGGFRGHQYMTLGPTPYRTRQFFVTCIFLIKLNTIVDISSKKEIKLR